MGRHCALLRNDLLVLLRQLIRRDDIDVTLLRRSGRASDPALVEQILAYVFALPGVTDTNDEYDRTFSEPNPSGATGFIDVPGSWNPNTPQCPG
jgi:hypothetical protein